MEEPLAAAGADVSLHNFSARLWEQLVHFHVMRLTDSLFLWVGATPHLRNLAVAMCSRYVSVGGAWAVAGVGQELGGDLGAGPSGRGRRWGGMGDWSGVEGGDRGRGRVRGRGWGPLRRVWNERDQWE